MSLITELIERLRKEADGYKGKRSKRAVRVKHILREAADTIETLSAKVQAANMEQSTAYYNGGWIPVSERLPEDGTYLVTAERIGGEPRIDMRSFAKDLHKVDEFDFPKHKYGWFEYNSEYGYWEDTKVIAWMPLPQAYKAESE